MTDTPLSEARVAQSRLPRARPGLPGNGVALGGAARAQCAACVLGPGVVVNLSVCVFCAGWLIFPARMKKCCRRC